MSSADGIDKRDDFKLLGFSRSRADIGRQFLPAALEILETPASPVGRAVGATIILFFAIAIAWSIFGHVDIIATASGKIVPKGRTKTIQPLEAGIVSAIHVRDGDKVTAGQALIELDRTVNEAERQRVAQDLALSRLDVARASARSATVLNLFPRRMTLSYPSGPPQRISQGRDRPCWRRRPSR
jgi:hemolysin D